MKIDLLWVLRICNLGRENDRWTCLPVLVKKKFWFFCSVDVRKLTNHVTLCSRVFSFSRLLLCYQLHICRIWKDFIYCIPFISIFFLFHLFSCSSFWYYCFYVFYKGSFMVSHLLAIHLIVYFLTITNWYWIFLV